MMTKKTAVRIDIPSKSRLIASALLLLGADSLVGCDDSKSMDRKQFVQCVGKLGAYGQAHPELVKGLAIDSERQCYALHWSIPSSYLPYLSPSGNLRITMAASDLTPGAYLPKERKGAETPDIEIKSLLFKMFSRRMDEIKVAGKAVYGLKKSGRTMYGREVYEATKAVDVSHEVLFYPDDDSLPIVSCGVGANEGVDQIKPYAPCKVWADIDGRVYAEYHVVYSLLPQLEQINLAMINRIRSFITPK